MGPIIQQKYGLLQRGISLALAAAILLPSAPVLAGPAAAPKEMNQKDTQLYNRQVNDRGSDESLRNSGTYAMQAIMDLGTLKLPSAVANGYKAYGKFRNSENLDYLKDQNAINANSLNSIDSGAATAPTKTITSFRRIDPSYLHQGEAGKVAAEFERMTGMKREAFFTQMAEISEKKIKRSDPMMVDKALSRFEDFVDKIPNAEFRKNMKKNIALVPETMRRGMVAQAVGKLAGFFADAGHAPAPDLASNITDAASRQLASGKGSAPVAPAASTSQSSGSAGGSPAAEKAASATANLGSLNGTPAFNKNARGDDKTLSNVVAAALATHGQDSVTGEIKADTAADTSSDSQEQTIFQQVTKRYRILTPRL